MGLLAAINFDSAIFSFIETADFEIISKVEMLNFNFFFFKLFYWKKHLRRGRRVVGDVGFIYLKIWLLFLSGQEI